MNNVMTGLFNSINPDIPHNAGTFRRVRVKLRENCVVGIPRFPHSCSVATTNVGERLVVTTQRTIADAWPGYGLAEGACGIGPGFAVVSGADRRRDGEPYVNQKFLGSQGGPAGPEIDGWITYGNAVTNGLMFRDSVIPAMNKVREACDAIELVVDDGLWPLPKYREMLFIH